MAWPASGSGIKRKATSAAAPIPIHQTSDRSRGWSSISRMLRPAMLQMAMCAAGIQCFRALGRSASGDGGVDQVLGFGLDLLEVAITLKRLGVDLVDVFSAGGAGGEPAVLR